jgi:hypothetical protein
MSGLALSITSRIVFLACGLTTLFTAFPYVMLRGAELPVQSEWVIFAVVLGLLGLFSVLVGVVPRSLIAKACGRNRDDRQLFSAPLKLLGIFAAIAYVVALVAHFSPHTWNVNAQLMLAVCPLYFVKMTIDPSPLSIFFLLAPMNAAVYGALGLALGYVGLALPNNPAG